MADGPAQPREGAGYLPRHVRQRLRLLEDVLASPHERWLDRARRFAMHALDQVRRLRAQNGRGRYSLWTGDLGVALYAADCITGRGGGVYPVLDEFY